MEAPLSVAIAIAWNPIYSRVPDIRQWLLTFPDRAVLEGLCVFSKGIERDKLCKLLVAHDPDGALQWAKCLYEDCVAEGSLVAGPPPLGQPDTEELASFLAQTLNTAYPAVP
jgi:hypothetical protein